MSPHQLARILGGIVIGLGLASLPFLQYRVGHHHPHTHAHTYDEGETTHASHRH